MATCTYQYNVAINTELGVFSVPYFKVAQNMPIYGGDVSSIAAQYPLECSCVILTEKPSIIHRSLDPGERKYFIQNVLDLYGSSNQIIRIVPTGKTSGGVDIGVSTGISYDYYIPFLFLIESSDNYYSMGTFNVYGDIGLSLPEHNKLGFAMDSGESLGRGSISVVWGVPPFGNNNFIGILTNYFRENPPQPAPVQSSDPYAQGGESETAGGEGDFDVTSDPIDFPALPSIGAIDTGFISIFNPTLQELKALATYMWTNPLFDLTAWKKIFADPSDAILGLSIIPVAVPDGGQRYITVGNMTTDVQMNIASQQYVEIQCGSINVNEYWGAYLDYSPYTKIELYLPYCGTHQLNTDDVMNKTIEVRYHIDILTGACCAYVKCGDSVLYTFNGQCASSIPISGGDFTNVINGVLSSAVAIGSMVATGGASAPLAVPALANTAINGDLKPNVEKSGSLSGTSGMLAIQKPYLILTRPTQALPANQNTYMGYPSFITAVLGDLTGYTEIEKIHLNGISATETELSEIETLLKQGVIL